jgi:hypothetical protein
MVGTPGIAVTLVRLTAFNAAVASKRGKHHNLPPLSIVRLSTVALAKTWKKGSTPNIRSSAGYRAGWRGCADRSN